MTKVKSCHLLDMLAKVTDPRKDKGKQHPLKSILTLMVIGLMCGHKGWTSIATWARSQPALAKELGFTHKRTPAASTIHNLLKRLDVVNVEKILTKWVNTMLESRPDLTERFDAGRYRWQNNACLQKKRCDNEPRTLCCFSRVRDYTHTAKCQ